jgi:hypothetical protein
LPGTTERSLRPLSSISGAEAAPGVRSFSFPCGDEAGICDFAASFSRFAEKSIDFLKKQGKTLRNAGVFRPILKRLFRIVTQPFVT